MDTKKLSQNGKKKQLVASNVKVFEKHQIYLQISSKKILQKSWTEVSTTVLAQSHIVEKRKKI